MASLRASRSASAKVTLGPATDTTLLHVLKNLTGPDYEEVVAGTGRNPVSLLPHFPFNTQVAWVKDTPVAIFGVSVDSLGAHPFLLTTPEIHGKGLERFIVEFGRMKVEEWRAQYGPLSNLVYTSNHAHVRFVRAMGFALGDTRRRGPLLKHFTEFHYV